MGSRFINKINGFIGQISVCNIPFAHDHRSAQHAFRNADPMICFIIMLDAPQNIFTIRKARFLYRNRLEAPFQGRILFDIFPVFRHCCSAYNLNFSTRQRGFHNISGIHGTFRISSTYNIMNLINYKYNVSRSLHFVQQAQYSGFKLPSELGSCYQSGKIH